MNNINKEIFLDLFAQMQGWGILVSKNGEIISLTNDLKIIIDESKNSISTFSDIFPKINFGEIVSETVDITTKKGWFEFPKNRKSYLSIVFKLVEVKKETYFQIQITDLTKIVKEESIKNILLNLASAEVQINSINLFYKTIQGELNKVIDARNLFVVQFDKYRHNLELSYITDEKDQVKKFPSGKSLSFYAIRNGKSLLIKTAGIIDLISKGEIELFGTMAKCWIGVPLKNSEEIFGLIGIQSYTNEEAYNEDDLQILEFISNIIALTIRRKENETNLRMAKEKAEETDKLKSAFLANMSHEIRTPMNAIIGFSELITRKSISQEKKDTYAQYITSSSKALLNLIDDIIDLAKIEAGQMKISKSNTHINLLLNELQEFFENEKKRINKNKIIFIKHQAVTDSTFSILCDSLRLKQILINLLNNALKFTPDGIIEFGYLVPNNASIMFFVRDTGIGLSDEKLSVIFERFRQADDSTTRQYGGTGLGLAISKKLVEMMGGRIWAESEKGKGSAFFFTLPLIIPSISKAKEEKHDAITSNSFEGKTILIAEDEDINYMFIEEVLIPTKATIIRAKTGYEAYNIFKTHGNISLVLMDIRMPELNGYQATKLIKDINPNVPVIAQTAYAMAEDRVKGLSSGCDDYLAKPIKPELLINTIKKYIY